MSMPPGYAYVMHATGHFRDLWGSKICGCSHSGALHRGSELHFNPGGCTVCECKGFHQPGSSPRMVVT